MKNNRYLLALSLMVAMAGQLVAQVQLEAPSNDYPVSFTTEVGTKASGKKAVESGWLSPSKLAEDYGATFAQSTYMPLFQDSSVFFVPSDQAANQNVFSSSWNLFGTVFQPNDPLYELQTTGWGFSRFTNYKCDSVRFPYSYIRQVNEVMIDGNMEPVVDTAFIYFFENKDLNTTWFFNSSEEIFTLPIRNNFNVANLGVKNLLFVDTLLLTADAATDTMLGETIPQGMISSAIDANVGQIGADNNNNEDNVIGVAVAFKTMLPYSFGDTLLSYNEAIVPDKKMNIFGTLSFGNSGSRVIQTEFNNNSFVTNKQVRYGQELGSSKGYLATLQSVGWGLDFYFPADFHVTGANVGINPLAERLGMKVYPNPANKGEELIIAANTTSSKVSIQLIDVVGNVIYNSGDLLSADTYQIPTAQLLPGIYFVSLTSEGVTATQKVVVTQ
jgi:Secretion system C-terminal sorting domain